MLMFAALPWDKLAVGLVALTGGMNRFFLLPAPKRPAKDLPGVLRFWTFRSPWTEPGNCCAWLMRR